MTALLYLDRPRDAISRRPAGRGGSAPRRARPLAAAGADRERWRICDDHPGPGEAGDPRRIAPLRPADRERAHAAVVPDLRRPALRHDVDVPRARRAPRDRQGRAAQGRALLRHRVRTGRALVSRPLSAASATANRRSERLGGVPVQTFESSPYYMYHPHAAERIARDLPDVKLIVLTRDPVERAYSQHAHEFARGFETEADFGAGAGAGEVAGCAARTSGWTPTRHAYSFSHQHHAYRARGEYIRYLRPLADLLGRDRIHVVDSAEFFASPEPVYDAVLDFLGLPPAGRGYPVFEQHNARKRALPIAGRRTGGADRALRAVRRGAGRLARPPGVVARVDARHDRPVHHVSRAHDPGRGAAASAAWVRSRAAASRTWSARRSPASPDSWSRGWSPARSAPSTPVRSSPPPSAFVLIGTVAKLGTQTSLVYFPARLRAVGTSRRCGGACGPGSCRSPSSRS